MTERRIVVPMASTVVEIAVEPGASFERGALIAVVEAMKMEHALLAPLDGRVSEISAEVGAQVAENARIMMIEATQQEG